VLRSRRPIGDAVKCRADVRRATPAGGDEARREPATRRENPEMGCESVKIKITHPTDVVRKSARGEGKGL